MERPADFGWFHLLFWALTLAFAVILVWRYRDASDRRMRTILFVVWIVLLVLEIYKQLSFSMDVEYGVANWSFKWYTFPFQFCSTPLYVLPLIVFLKDGAVRRCIITFFSTFVFFAGLVVMIYPNDVFTSVIGINIQTMIHHGAQVALGIYLAAYNRRHMTIRRYFGSLLVFCAFAVVAMVLNECFYSMLMAQGNMTDAFNMFYISPHYDCTLPILSIVYKAAPYPVFLIVYLLGFALVSAIFFFAEKGIIALASRKSKNTDVI